MRIDEIPQNPALILFDRVSKVYGAEPARIVALSSISLSIRSGDFVAVMGPSGSGKSTTMNILGCLATPSSGSYRFKGVEVSQLDTDERALLRRHFIGFVFQGFNLLDRTTAIENVEMPLIYRGMKTRERRERAMAALASVGLADRATHTPGELPGGQQQRVAIARAIVTEPAVLLADEPTGNLDSRRSAEIMDLLTRLNTDLGITVVVVTHDTAVAGYGRRQIEFSDGRIASDRKTRELVS